MFLILCSAAAQRCCTYACAEHWLGRCGSDDSAWVYVDDSTTCKAGAMPKALQMDAQIGARPFAKVQAKTVAHFQGYVYLYLAEDAEQASLGTRGQLLRSLRFWLAG